jgi:hypothetical protein
VLPALKNAPDKRRSGCECSAASISSVSAAAFANVIEKKNAAVRFRVAMNQCTDIAILGKKYPSFANSLRQQRFVARVDWSFCGISHVMTYSPQREHRLCYDIGIGEKAHAIQRRW